MIYGNYSSNTLTNKIKTFNSNDIIFHEVPELQINNSLKFLRTVLPTTRILQLKKIIKEFSPEVVNIHGYGLLFINQCANILIKLNIPYLYTLHGAPVTPGKLKGPIGIAYNLYNRTLGKKILQNATQISAVSDFTKKFPEFYEYESKIRTIPNGINCDELISEKIEKLNPFDIYTNGKNQIIFFSIGRLEWLKGFQLFFNCLGELKKNNIDFVYLIAGDDNGYKKELESFSQELGLQNNIHFIGKADFHTKCQYYFYTDFVVVPSIIENFPAVPLEALSFKKIVLANNAGGIPEIIKNNENGFLFEMDNYNTTSKKLVEIIKNKALLKKIKDNININQYDWKYIAKLYENELRKIVTE